MSSVQQLTLWLNSVYAIEQSLIKNLEAHIRDAEDQPEIRLRLDQHLADTRAHADRVEQCLELLGAKPSAAKAMFGNVMGMVQGASTSVFRDELMKNFIADYTMEHLEIASYRAVIAAAEELGESEIARMCREILAEEEAMAMWLEEKLPEVTRLTLRQVANA